jgi:putative FmdB family regulatory protein
MPLYQYKCDACDGVFEVIQRFSDAPLAVHDGCGGKVERLLCAPALRFKGSGWYVTDYARKNGGKPAGSAQRGSSDSKDGPAKADSSSSTKTGDTTAKADK